MSKLPQNSPSLRLTKYNSRYRERVHPFHVDVRLRPLAFGTSSPLRTDGRLWGTTRSITCPSNRLRSDLLPGRRYPTDRLVPSQYASLKTLHSDLNPGAVAPLVRKIRGGLLRIQGTWLPCVSSYMCTSGPDLPPRYETSLCTLMSLRPIPVSSCRRPGKTVRIPHPKRFGSFVSVFSTSLIAVSCRSSVGPNFPAQCLMPGMRAYGCPQPLIAEPLVQLDTASCSCPNPRFAAEVAPVNRPRAAPLRPPISAHTRSTRICSSEVPTGTHANPSPMRRTRFRSRETGTSGPVRPRSPPTTTARPPTFPV
jgi:hypothetical protein